jgi:hypothetical protein
LRHRNFNKNRHSNGSSFQSSVTDLPQKPAAEDGNKLGEGKKKKKKKRKTNTLGLTPHTEEYEDSEEEDDADEESRLAAAIESADAPKYVEPARLDGFCDFKTNTLIGNRLTLLLGLPSGASDGLLRHVERQRRLNLRSGAHKLLNSLQETNQKLKRSARKERLSKQQRLKRKMASQRASLRNNKGKPRNFERN